MKILLIAGLLVASATAPQYRYTYVNYSPDRSYTASEDEKSVGMGILMDLRTFGLGHIFDVLKPCTTSLDDCVVFNGEASSGRCGRKELQGWSV